VNLIEIPTSVIEPAAAAELIDCDFIFLAADQHLGRMLFNAITHQYLIPGIQLGTRVDVDPVTGEVSDIQSNLRLVLPCQGCLRCNRMIDAGKIQDEAIGEAERERDRYIDEAPAPSVITFNTRLAAEAVTDFPSGLSCSCADTTEEAPKGLFCRQMRAGAFVAVSPTLNTSRSRSRCRSRGTCSTCLHEPCARRSGCTRSRPRTS
jgi:hypothetical protein